MAQGSVLVFGIHGNPLLSGRTWRAIALGTTALAGQLLATPASAQATTEPATVANNEIVVTAQRRAELLEDVPMSVTFVQAQTLENANVTNMHEINRIAAGVQVNYAGVSTGASVRGITSLTNGLGNENNVATYVDGFYISDNQSINMDLVNVVNIQVLKGPQGTLYGRNASGGAILITTLDPTDTMTSKFQASFGKFDEIKVGAYAAGPITENIGFMVSASSRTSDGWIKFSDPTDNSKDAGNAAPQVFRSFRTKLAFTPSDSFKAIIGYNYTYGNDPSGLMFTTFEHIPPNAFPGFPFPSGNQKANRFGTASYNGEASAASSTDQITLKMELDTGIGILTSYTAYDWRKHRNAFDFDGTYVDITYSDIRFSQDVFQQAVDYSITAIENVDLLIGGLYYNDKLKHTGIGNATYSFGTLLSSVYRPLQTEAWAIYADATFHATPELSISVGGRYSEDRKTVSQVSKTGTGVTTLTIPETHATFDKFTPRATIRYEIAPSTNVYASYSQGFRSGAFNAAPQSPPATVPVPVKPEEITAYEIGFKTAQSNFRFDIAAYYYDFKNLQVSLTVPQECGQPVCPVVLLLGNAPKSEIYGIDGQFTYTPVDNLNLSLGAAWIHARYGDFANAVGTGLNSALDVNVPNQTQDWSNNQMARAPNFTANLNADYTADLGDSGELLFAGNVSYSDSYVISNPSIFGPLADPAIADQQRLRAGSLTLVNASIDWTDASGHLTFGIWGKNLTDKTYRLTYNAGAFGDYSTMGAPISYGVRMGYNF